MLTQIQPTNNKFPQASTADTTTVSNTNSYTALSPTSPLTMTLLFTSKSMLATQSPLLSDDPKTPPTTRIHSVTLVSMITDSGND